MTDKKKLLIPKNFDSVTLGIASSEDVFASSYGEVETAATKNYRTGLPEERGLFCERIFGPEENFKCACKKYKGIRYRYTICDRCGVEVNRRSVRKERTGHIVPVRPLVNPLFYNTTPNILANILGVSGKGIISVIDLNGYIVIQSGSKEAEGLQKMDILTPREYQSLLEEIPESNKKLPDSDPEKIIIETGSKAIKKLLLGLDLDQIVEELRQVIKTTKSQQKKKSQSKRLWYINLLRKGIKKGNKIDSIVMSALSVIPPDYRPMQMLPRKQNTFATHSYSELLQKILHQTKKLKNLALMNPPEVIEKHVARSVEAALRRYICKRPSDEVSSSKPVQSVTNALSGKSGRFRANRLGTRVDYSGRSVIIPGPQLKIYECGLPKQMAAELFKPFVVRRIMERGLAATVKEAKQLVDSRNQIIWEILNDILAGHAVLLNRAPTLHRLGIQAFKPKLIEGKAIQLPALVCKAFGADYDGDQMAVHVPLTKEALVEANVLMLSANNIINPANGSTIAVPSLEMISGFYYLTLMRPKKPNDPAALEGKLFGDRDEVILAYNNKKVGMHTPIRLITKIKEGKEFVEKRIETTAGRVLFNEILPKEIGFINVLINKKEVQSLVAQVYKELGLRITVKLLDELKELGFKYAYESGISFGINDIKVPKEKQEIVTKAQEAVNECREHYYHGLITDSERYNQTIDIWTHANTEIANKLIHQLAADQDGFNSVYIMLNSGARGSKEQIRQLGGMKGLMGNTQKKEQENNRNVIEVPIINNLMEGITPLAAFFAAHGARQGLGNKAIKTAESGYFSRKLTSAAQDGYIDADSCNTIKGARISPVYDEDNEVIDPISVQVAGRIAINDIVDPATNQVIAKGGTMISLEQAEQIDQAKIKEVIIRSPLTCNASFGICRDCYGIDLSNNKKKVSNGAAVGIIAAQSIAEPATQLTMQTLHKGGVASSVATTFNIKTNQKSIVVFNNIETIPFTNRNGDKVSVVSSKMGEIKMLDPENREEINAYFIPYGAHLTVSVKEQMVEEGVEVCYWDPYNAPIISKVSGKARFEGIKSGISYKEEYDPKTGYKAKVIIASSGKKHIPTMIITDQNGEETSYILPADAYIAIEHGNDIVAGQVIAKMPRKRKVNHDITGGLPRITSILEARKNIGNQAIVSEVTGVVSYGPIKRNKREIQVEAQDGSVHSYMVPLSTYLLVQPGDPIKSGEFITSGLMSSEQKLRILGFDQLCASIINELQSIYRIQGVQINRKHFEVVISQLMKKVSIIDMGDTEFLPGQLVNKVKFAEENKALYDKRVILEVGDSNFQQGELVDEYHIEKTNQALQEEGKEPATFRKAKMAVAERVLQGMSSCVSNSDSWLAAASFQQTSRALAIAAVEKATDDLRGINANIILSREIPVGTGHRFYKNESSEVSQPIAR